MLEGSLDTFPLPSVLRLLDDTGHTGRLSIHAALGRGSLVFENGRLVDVDGPDDDPIESALALFDFHTGTFTFRLENVDERSLDLDIAEFLELADERQAAWVEIRATIPTDGPLVVVPLEVGDRADGEVTISTEAWKIAVSANGRTTNQLASLAGTSEFRACSILLELLQAGLIGFGGRQTPRPSQQQRAPEPADLENQPTEETQAATETSDAELDPEDLLRELGESAAPAAPARKRLSRR